MDIRHLSPCVRFAADCVRPAPWKVKERVIGDYEVLYLKEGEAVVTVEDRVYWGIPGDLFLFQPRQRHSIRSASTQSIRQTHIRFDLVHDPDSPEVRASCKTRKEMAGPEPLGSPKDERSERPCDLPERIKLRDPLLFENMMFGIIHEFEQQIIYYETKIKGMMIDLLVYLLREHHWERMPHVHSNREVLLMVQQYLYLHADSHVTLDELADAFGFSKFYLNRMFRSAFQVSPMQYHQQIRLEKAKQAIRMTDQPLKRIAEQFGYPNVHAFSRSFKKQQGVPPSYYRSNKG